MGHSPLWKITCFPKERRTSPALQILHLPERSEALATKDQSAKSAYATLQDVLDSISCTTGGRQHQGRCMSACSNLSHEAILACIRKEFCLSRRRQTLEGPSLVHGSSHSTSRSQHQTHAKACMHIFPQRHCILLYPDSGLATWHVLTLELIDPAARACRRQNLPRLHMQKIPSATSMMLAKELR